MARKIAAENVGHDVKEILSLLADDIAELRTQLIALLAKLDADEGTDDDYESTLTPDAQSVVR